MSDLVQHHVPTARDIMATSVVTVASKLCIFEAVGVLLKNGISGVPVVDDSGDLVGMLSELDCLRILASDEFYLDDHVGATVADFMRRGSKTVGPETDIYAIAHYFLTMTVRRFPVVDEGGHLLGQVSRRDVLRAIEKMRAARAKKHYPDYREPK